MPSESIHISTELNFNQFLPIVTGSNVEMTDYYRGGDSYLLFKKPGASSVTLQFMLPPAYRNVSGGILVLTLNHCRTSGNGIIDMSLNGQSFMAGYRDAPFWGFGLQDFQLPYSRLNVNGINTFTVTLSGSSPGVYWLSDVAFTIEDQSQCLAYSAGRHFSEDASGQTFLGVTGATYANVDISQDYRAGNPYLLFKSPGATCSVSFLVPDTFDNVTDGVLTVAINHCRTSGDGVVNILLNNNMFRQGYGDAPKWNFGVQTFDIPFSSLRRGGQMNTFDISLVTGSSYGFYWLSDIALNFSSAAPDFTYDNFERYVKNWILQQRSNIAELNPVPRDDMGMWQFIQNAPSWFYLPFLKVSPTEISVVLRHFPTNAYNVGMDNKVIAQQARDFHLELLSTDLPRKNALRHAYWMALVTRKYSALFADELGNAHEYAHVDLTIEGPFDHVTDKINNAVGIELAKADSSTDCAVLVDGAWSAGRLAWAKNFREENGGQTADVYWQQPLNYLAQTYSVIPDFSDSERQTLQRMSVTIPNLHPIHDEL